MTNYDDLKRLAEAVRNEESDWQPTQATWEYFNALRAPATVLELIAYKDALAAELRQSWVDRAKHIEALTVEFDALKAENEKLSAHLNLRKRRIDSGNECLGAAASRIDELMVEVEALRKDAERYRWLRNPGSLADGCFEKEVAPGIWQSRYGEDMDMSIDAAMNEEGK